MQEQLRLDIDDPNDSLTLRTLWQSVLEDVAPRLGREAIDGWLSDAEPLGLAEGRLTLGVPNATARTWVERKYAAELSEALTERQGEEISLQVMVQKNATRGSAKAGGRETEREAPRPAEVRLQSVSQRSAAPPPGFSPLPLNEKFTFERYVVGHSNRFAHAAAAAVAKHPGKEYNPLFIYGGVGLGKTHLLQGIGNALLQQNPRARVAYVSGETFTTHFVTSLRERREEDFRRSYRGVDLWLVDDIQFIANKTGTKEEFFHTFNELYLTNRHIVLAADRPPRELHLMEDRLRTRLESGLMVEIVPPDLETRIAILLQRAEMEGVEIPSDVIYQIAATVTDNVRVLEAALVRMLALASLQGCAITPDLAARALGAFVRESAIAQISVLAIQRAVCEQFQVGEQELTGPRRDRVTSLARQVAMYLMRELSKKSLSEIGEVFGGKTHSTVHYSCSKLEKEMREDASLAETVRSLRIRLANPAP